jgi:cell division protein ZapA
MSTLKEYDMNTSKRMYEVQVAGVPLKLRSSHDSDTVNELIQLVDQRVQQALSSAPTISFQNALLLSALNIAEELMLLKKAARIELATVETRAQRLLDQIEESRSLSARLDC